MAGLQDRSILSQSTARRFSPSKFLPMYAGVVYRELFRAAKILPGRGAIISLQKPAISISVGLQKGSPMIQLVETPRAALADVLITHQLGARPSRLPDYAGEAAALRALVNLLADSPQAVLQLLVDKIIELTGAQSSGISIAEMNGDDAVFRWHANAGEFAPCAGSTMPRHDSPCGTVLDQNAPPGANRACTSRIRAELSSKSLQ